MYILYPVLANSKIISYIQQINVQELESSLNSLIFHGRLAKKITGVINLLRDIYIRYKCQGFFLANFNVAVQDGCVFVNSKVLVLFDCH